MNNQNTSSGLLKNEEFKFWASHIIVLLGTVFGVYLAASAGLKSAVQFELVKSDRDSFYMRSALLDEFDDNLKNIEKWGVDYKGGNARNFMGKPDEFKLDTYVWTTMQESPGTFEIPKEILTGVRRYYVNTDNHLRKMTSNGPAADQVDAMLAETKQIRSEILPLIKQDLEQLTKRLKKAGVDV